MWKGRVCNRSAVHIENCVRFLCRSQSQLNTLANRFCCTSLSLQHAWGPVMDCLQLGFRNVFLFSITSLSPSLVLSAFSPAAAASVLSTFRVIDILTSITALSGRKTCAYPTCLTPLHLACSCCCCCSCLPSESAGNKRHSRAPC